MSFVFVRKGKNGNGYFSKRIHWNDDCLRIYVEHEHETRAERLRERRKESGIHPGQPKFNIDEKTMARRKRIQRDLADYRNRLILLYTEDNFQKARIIWLRVGLLLSEYGSGVVGPVRPHRFGAGLGKLVRDKDPDLNTKLLEAHGDPNLLAKAIVEYYDNDFIVGVGRPPEEVPTVHNKELAWSAGKYSD